MATVERVLDRGAVFAGWVGVGMAMVIAISFELVVAVQSLVFLVALPAGLLIGFYANARSERRRPWWRVVVNALYAGLLTGLTLAVLYGALRLLFIYADTGYRDATQGGPLVCQTGPECTYLRYVDQAAKGIGPDLAAAGVTDAASFEQYMLREQLNAALILTGLVTGGAIVGGAAYALLGPAAKVEGAGEEAAATGPA
ncbi:MAG: hypothetical protein ACXVAE_01495 [Candidatus Limnocylindrales bacterium]